MSHPISHKQKLIDLLQNCKGATILDYGCGRGDFINILLNSPNTPSLIVAADSDPAMIECINQSFSTTISQGRVITKTISTPTELQGTKFDNIITYIDYLSIFICDKGAPVVLKPFVYWANDPLNVGHS